MEFLTKNLRKNMIFKTGKKILVYVASDTKDEQSKDDILLVRDQRNEFQAMLPSYYSNGSSLRYDGEQLAAYKATDLTLESQQLPLGFQVQ